MWAKRTNRERENLEQSFTVWRWESWKHVTSKSSKDLTPANWTNAENVRRRLEQRVTMTRTNNKSFVFHYHVQRRDRYINEDYT